MENMITGEVIREILVQFVGFVAFFFVLKMLAWKPLLKLMDERRQKIEKGFADIESTRKEVESMKSDYENRLAQVENEARQKIQEAVEEGRRSAHVIEQEARDEAHKILQKAETNIQLEIDKARIELKAHIVGLAVKATERILKEKVDEAKHKKMTLEFIEDAEIKT